MSVAPTLSPEILAQQLMMRKATRASLAVAVSLIAQKAGAWWWTDAVSMLASLLDSTTDALASGVTLVAVHASLEPADEEHRFGHGKQEPLAGLAQSVLVLGSAIWLAVSAVQRLRNPQPISMGIVGIAVMLIASAATLFLVRYQRKVSAATRSTAVNADRLHYESDLLMNAVVIISLAASSWLGWQILDPLLGMCVAVLVARSAWQIAWDSVQLLMDREFPDSERHVLVEAVLAHPSRQAAVDHVLLARRQRDAGTLQDQPARPLEILLRVGKLAHRFGAGVVHVRGP